MNVLPKSCGLYVQFETNHTLYCNESSLGTEYTKFVPSSNAQSRRMQKFHGIQEDGIIVFHPFHPPTDHVVQDLMLSTYTEYL